MKLIFTIPAGSCLGRLEQAVQSLKASIAMIGAPSGHDGIPVLFHGVDRIADWSQNRFLAETKTLQK